MQIRIWRYSTTKKKIKNTTVNSNEPQSGFCLILLFFCYNLHFVLEMMWQQSYFSKAAVRRSIISTFSWGTSVFHNINEERCGCVSTLLLGHHGSTEMLRCPSGGSHSLHKGRLEAFLHMLETRHRLILELLAEPLNTDMEINCLALLLIAEWMKYLASNRWTQKSNKNQSN